MNLTLLSEDDPKSLRKNRCYNIAVFLAEIIPHHIKCNSINSQLLRKLIREKLKMKVLADKKLFDGDLKGHGDSVGGHGLKLECQKKRGVVDVLLNDVNYQKCLTFIKKFNGGDEEDQFRKIVGL